MKKDMRLAGDLRSRWETGHYCREPDVGSRAAPDDTGPPRDTGPPQATGPPGFPRGARRLSDEAEAKADVVVVKLSAFFANSAVKSSLLERSFAMKTQLGTLAMVLAFVAAMVLCLGTAGTASAAPIYWSAGSSGDWSVPANWGGSVPGATDVAGFQSTAYTVAVDTAGNSVNGLRFDSTGWTLNGPNALALGSGSLQSGWGIYISGAHTAVINAPLTLSASQTWYSAGGTLEAHGKVSGAAGNALSLRNGTTKLYAANDYAGGTSIVTDPTQVWVFDDQAFGTGPVSVQSTLTLRSGDSNARTLANNLNVSANMQLNMVAGLGALTLDGTITLQNNIYIWSQTTSPVIFAGTIQDDAPANHRVLTLYLGNVQTVSMKGHNTYSGGTQLVEGGRVNLFDDQALGTGTVTVSGVGLQAGDINPRVLANNIDATGGFGLNRVNDRGSLTLNGTVTLKANIGIWTQSNSPVIFGGTIQQDATPRSLTFYNGGIGTVTMLGSNTYSGGTDLPEGGTLLVNNTTGSGTGSGPVFVRAAQGGATLGGTGIIGGNTTFEANANLAPGNSVGKLTFTKNLTLVADTDYLWQLGSGGAPAGAYDQAVVSGSGSLLALPNSWDLELWYAGGGALTTDKFYIFPLLDGAALSGTLGTPTITNDGNANWLTGDPGWHPTVAQDGGGVYLTGIVANGERLEVLPVAEPSALGLLLVGLPILGLRKRRS